MEKYISQILWTILVMIEPVTPDQSSFTHVRPPFETNPYKSMTYEDQKIFINQGLIFIPRFEASKSGLSNLKINQ